MKYAESGVEVYITKDQKDIIKTLAVMIKFDNGSHAYIVNGHVLTIEPVRN